MKRREFLAAAAAAPLYARKTIDRSRIAVLTDEVAKSPADAIQFAKQYGLRWIELRGLPGGGAHYARISPEQAKEAAKEFAGNGLKVSFLNTGFFKITLPGTEPVFRKPEDAAAREKRIARHQKEFDGRIEELKRAIENAHIYGVDKMRVFTFLRVAEPRSTFQRAAEVINEMAEVAARSKIKLLVENEGACNVVTCAEMAEFMKLVPKNVGINWDPMNGVAQKEAPYPDGYKLLPKKLLWNVQMKGHSLLDAQRKLGWNTIFHALDKDGYTGQVGLETHYFDGTNLEKSHASVKEIFRILES